MKNLKNNYTKRGFTLIELLVVIAIISLLSSVVLAALRDAREIALASEITQNILQLKTALELYVSDRGYYPIPDNGLNSDNEKDTDFLKTELVDNNYISSIEIPNEESPDITDFRDRYLTGQDPDSYGVYIDDQNGAVCGDSGVLKGYVFYFYSSLELDLPKVGSISDGTLSPDVESYNGQPSTNTYCIGA